jgi:N-acetylmuramic acid 6-phosphate etherase
VRPQLWLPSFGLTAEEIPDLEAAIEGARAEGIDDLWTWGYEACGHMTRLATPDAPLVWEAVSAALTRRSQKPTEAVRDPDLELRTTRRLVGLLNAEDSTVAGAVAEAGDELAAAIDALAPRLSRGGRLIYVGAGTSGRLAALDAAECGPTFGSRPGEVVAVVAGDAEDAEDDREAGAADLGALAVGADDVVVGVSASGSTPYTLAALEAAGESGALRIAVACVRGSALAELAEHEIAVVVGPEAVAGSTRLKAGTAQKLVLNTISTVTMVRLGRTYAGLMVGVSPENAKLRERARRNLMLASGAAEEAVDAALAAAGNDGRVALVTLLAGVDPEVARERLAEAGGSVRAALGETA